MTDRRNFLKFRGALAALAAPDVVPAESQTSLASGQRRGKDNTPSSSEPETAAPRMFIQTSYAPANEVAGWVELALTEGLLSRIKNLDQIRIANNLLEVKADIDAVWNFHPGYRQMPHHWPCYSESRLIVSESYLQIETRVECDSPDSQRPLGKTISVLQDFESGKAFYDKYHVAEPSEGVIHLEWDGGDSAKHFRSQAEDFFAVVFEHLHNNGRPSLKPSNHNYLVTPQSR